MSLNDQGYVDDQYRTIEKLETRISVWQALPDGQSPQDVALKALREVRPHRMLEVGSGTGTFAVRCASELGCHVSLLDSSPAMVDACSKEGLDAIIGDVQEIPFPDGSFDVAVAAWMLYHVADLAKAISELARVLRPGGRLVAITNGRDHLAELWDLARVSRVEPTFSRENGAEWLESSFQTITWHDIASPALFPNRGAAVAYLTSMKYRESAERLPDFVEPLRAWGTPTVFIADKAT